MNEKQEMNHLDERKVYYVVYNAEDFKKLNQEDDKGSVVQANMKIQDDTDPIHATNKIYAVAALKDFVPSSDEDLGVDLEVCRNELYDLFLKADDRCNDDAYLERFVDEGENSPADYARYDLLRIERGLLDEDEDASDVVENRCNDFCGDKDEKEYLCEFLRRCGKGSIPKSMASVRDNVSKWLEATPLERLYNQRTQKQLERWHNHRFGSGKVPSNKSQIVGDILGFDLPKLPVRPKTAKQLYREANRDDVKKGNPNASVKEINKILNADFDDLCEDQSRKWDEEARKDKTRYEEEMKTYRVGNPDDEVYYLKRFNMPCGCNPCLSNNLDACLSPYKKYMRPKIVRMKVKQKAVTKNV